MRDDEGRFMRERERGYGRSSRYDHDYDDRRGSSYRERDEFGRFMSDDDDYRPRRHYRDDDYRGGSFDRERDERGRFMSDDDNGYRRYSRDDDRDREGRSWYGDPEGH